MATLTATQIAMVAWNAGIHDEPTITRAVAIALAESSGVTDKLNNNPATGDLSYGLWQINMIGAMGPARRKEFDIATNEALFDPITNGHAMFKISKGGKNWSAWGAFTNNAYMKYVNAGKIAAKEIIRVATSGAPRNPFSWIFEGIGSAKDAVGGVGESIANGLDVGGSISASFNSLSASLMRLGLNVFAVIFAAILIILAIVIMLRAPLAKAASTVAGVAGPGKVSKGAAKVATVAKAVK